MTLSLNTPLILVRKKETLTQYGLGRSTFHARINEGLITPAVSLGDRAVAWPAHETQQVIAAMVAGKTKDEIKALVIALVDERQNLLEKL
ncbi:helix-turn-helix transcriptional regulator [Colwellia hornerae]|uniref:AlpA family phage regulatory protein n=1 Tax=Colwellia hornerae TaxID=89402 RepID=A0A5C6QFR5_9GAMM|nr:AlpA family phage regulatory protein [Colwellia hornerae]TWX52319.1 AlpA family phage regulatory protein [Colwellia hornerae]TWX57878.1 AlpA family phage regulatory protein [Colwellia hornerae]TWX67580.1 AlpA family phage regulatory protein [Colwellia hornerae]